MSILTSDLACCASSDKVLHLFFQEGQNIREARSPDGGAAWTTQEIVIAKDGEANGSAMTCYYVDKDANFDNKPSIHLLYLNKDKELMEKLSAWREKILFGRTSRSQRSSRNAQSNIRN